MTMDILFTNQTEIYESMAHLLSNFKKDGASRKTPDYCKRKLEILEAYWREYLVNHKKMCEHADFGHVYFVKNCFETAEEVYATMKELLEKTGFRKQQPEESRAQVVSPPEPETEATQPGTSAPPAPHQRTLPALESRDATRLDELLKKQTINMKAFMRTVSSIKVDELEKKWEFEDALKSLESRWSNVDSLHWQIEGENGAEDWRYQREFSKHEEMFMLLKKTINTKMFSVAHREKSTPQLDIPIFNGNYHLWVSFKDLFTEAIHNNPTMSDAQKMQYLKGKVTGEAERLIHHLQISSDNYQVCWEILNHRYDNKKLIFTSHINILLNVPTMQQQSSGAIKNLFDVTKECLHAIQNLGIDVSTWDPLLVHLLAQKLDNVSYMEYITSIKQSRELPILQEFLDYLETKFTTLEASRRKGVLTNHKPTHQQPAIPCRNPNLKSNFQSNNIYRSFVKQYNSPKTSNNVAPRSTSCGLCNDDHGIWQCPQFLRMQHEQRLHTVNKLHYCVNCLFNHNKEKCLSNKKCRKCLGSHNTLLHEALGKSCGPSTSKHHIKPVSNVTTTEDEARSSQVPWEDISEILLATAIVRVNGADGTIYHMRALIDQGSQISLINENAAQILGFKRTQCKGKIFGIGKKENSSKGMINIEISSIYNDFSLNTNVIIMNTLIKSLPNKTFTKPSWPYIQNINLADPDFNISRPVDLLLGAEAYSKIMMSGILRSDKGDQPIAQQTQLGWLLCGTMKPHYNCNVILHNTDDLLRFWENEDINQETEMTSEDEVCMDFFLRTTRRLENGRYEVRLPFKPDAKKKLGATKPQALAQFYSLEKKLLKNQELREDYQKFMTEYLTLNHMIPSTSNQPIECYLPHHAVTREESTTTKLRVVFNASAPSTSGYSLNDVLYKGPNIQQDLQTLILRWRQYQYVFTADVEKMYRQIMMHKDDQPYQKILWRNSAKERVKCFQLTTVSYGTKPAGWLAMMCLKQLAKDESHNYPEAAKELGESFYMDDYCGGAHSIEKANKIKLDLNKMLKTAGFNLRKWTSNKTELLEGLEIDQRNHPIYEFKQSNSTKTLGLGWNPQKDIFIFESKIESKPSTIPTKRTLLSDISKLFDPLGWLTPISTTMKMLFQKVWMLNLDWDQELPESIKGEWIKLRQDLELINTIKVSRWLKTSENQTIELHGFCDASTKAYACVIYCKATRESKSTITLVAAKARLAPLSKVVSTPRLELMGALLLSQLVHKIQVSLTGYHIQIHCWTDSTAVLGWIRGDLSRWKLFVANRVKTITKIIPADQWHYVKTNENPADCASRGLPPKDLVNHHLYWQGPSWLSTYRNPLEDQTIYQTNLEVKRSFLRHAHAIIIKKGELLISYIVNHLLNKFNSIGKIIRILAWILRIPKKQVRRPYLTVHELRSAKMLIIKTIQQTEFADDLEHLRKHGKVHCKSKILNLNPIVCSDGLLRVGGRLRNAQIKSEMKHPIIIPHNHRLTTLLINQAHDLTFHGGARLTLANLRQLYWIINGYMATKKFIRQCVTCRKHDPIKHYQLMGDLPSCRVNPENAFYHCGVDYTGFVEVKANKGRGIRTTKGYISIFICMVTKAVHLELVSDLTSSAFLAALSRMAARRGTPAHMYSDNGGNFVAANRMLQEEYDQLQLIFNDSFLKEITEMGIEWHFNIPSWPSAGGLWERAVRSLKHHLKRVIGFQRLTYEEYSTLLAKLEACLNSRPLCALSEDPEDFDFLTPAHFLNGRPGLTVIETEHDARTRWHLTCKLFQDLWKRWKIEYLTQLSSRNKWLKPQKNISVGDLVVIQDDNLPAGKWAMGRVIDTHPGDDGLVRAVTLKTKNGTLKRPIVKLSVLPVHTEKDSKDQISKTPEKLITSLPSRNISKQRPTFASLATAFYCFIMLIIPTYGLHEIKPLPENQTIYFEPITKINLIRDKWTLVVYYDMKPYWIGIDAYKRTEQYLEKLCNFIDKQSHCNMISRQAQHDYQELEYYNALLLNQHFSVHARRRRRRGLINGIGYLANDLFGVLDSRFAEQYAKDIDIIRHNEQHLSNLWKNQTSVIEAEFNLMKEMKDTVEKQHKVINRKLNELQDNTSIIQREIQNISYVQEFMMSAMAGNTLLLSLKRLQNTLLDTITDIYHGQISLHLLTPTQLKRELQTITSQLPSEVTLPIKNIDADLHALYKLLSVKTSATKDYIIIEVTFPLIGRESFQLYRLIAIPHQTKSLMVSITPISEYVAVNLKKDSYFSVTNRELAECLRNGDLYICQILKPILTINNDQSFCDMDTYNNKCKINKSTCTNKWVELNSKSQYLYFCCDLYPIKIICGDRVTLRQLSRAGVIGMSKNCIIKGKDFSLYSLQHQSNKMNVSSTIYIPEFDQLNRIIDIKFSSKDLADDDNLNASLTSLGESVRKLKESDASIEDITPHDLHHYVAIYVLVAAVLCAVSVWMWRSRRCCPPRVWSSGTGVHAVAAEGETSRRLEMAERPRPAARHRQELSTPSEPSRSEVPSVSVSVQNLAKRWPSVRGVKKDNNLENSVV